MLSLRTVAEGIEDSQQFRALRDLGCELGQGYLFAKPQPPEAFTALLASSKAGVPTAAPAAAR
jgi:EAL domain-containing protein (putative c-di-GMP-specific phosphodiesterase class I)